MEHNYSNMTASHCPAVNLGVLLMEGFLCHVCLPNPCEHGSCAHHGGVYTLGGFTCDCNGTGYSGDVCQSPLPPPQELEQEQELENRTEVLSFDCGVSREELAASMRRLLSNVVVRVTQYQQAGTVRANRNSKSAHQLIKRTHPG